MAASKVIMLKKVPMAFPELWDPKAIGDGEPAWGARFIIDPEENASMVKLLDSTIKEVAVMQWKDKADEVLELLREDKKICFEKFPYRSKKTGKVYEGFEGKYSLGARNSKTRPTLVDINGGEITTKADAERILYSGAVVHAKVEIWAQDNSWGRRINCSPLGIMFNRHGERFGGGSGPADAADFAEYAQSPEETMEGASGGKSAEDYV